MLVREREVLVSAVSIVTIDKQTKPPACMALSASPGLRRFLQVSRSVDGPGTLRIILGIGGFSRGVGARCHGRARRTARPRRDAMITNTLSPHARARRWRR